MIRAVIADDNAVIRQGLVSLLEVAGDIEVVAQASTGAEAVEAVARHEPDLVLLDVRMPVRDGVSAAGELSATTPVLMLTYADDAATITAALQAGARGYLVHGAFTPEELQATVREVAGGGSMLAGPAAQVALDALRGVRPARRRAGRLGLSERECEIMELLAEGRTNQAIASELFITHKTVKNHLSRIYTRIGVANRGEAVAAWMAAAREEELHGV
jgi:DNA-binding NarL/FixJ family response regulator